MSSPSDPRAAVEYRVAAASLKPGDLVNTSPGEDDWQQVVGVYTSATEAKSEQIRGLAGTLGGRYVIVQLTDLAPVDGGIYFDGTTAMVYGDEDGDDHPVADVISDQDGIRTYLYAKFELVSVRAV